MKIELAEYISRCFECQQVKTEHQHPAGLLQPLPIPSWKTEENRLLYLFEVAWNLLAYFTKHINCK